MGSTGILSSTTSWDQVSNLNTCETITNQSYLDFVSIAFKAAKAADSGAKLYISACPSTLPTVNPTNMFTTGLWPCRFQRTLYPYL